MVKRDSCSREYQSGGEKSKEIQMKKVIKEKYGGFV